MALPHRDVFELDSVESAQVLSSLFPPLPASGSARVRSNSIENVRAMVKQMAEALTQDGGAVAEALNQVGSNSAISEFQEGNNTSIAATQDGRSRKLSAFSSCSASSQKPRSIMKTDSETGQFSPLRCASCSSVASSSSSSSKSVRFSSAQTRRYDSAAPPTLTLTSSISDIVSHPILHSRPRARQVPAKQTKDLLATKHRGMNVWHFAGFMLGFVHPLWIVFFFLIVAFLSPDTLPL
eukprot:3930763-Rhodomonas_salina.1